MIKLIGRIEIKDGGVRIVTGWDLCRYYKWHIDKHFWGTVKTQLPKYGSHVSVVLPLHKVQDFTPVMHLNGRVVEFEIYPEKLYRSPKNFWIPAFIPIAQEIKDILGVKDDKNFYGNHITISNFKFN